jgi:hypothetical protein
MIGGKIYVALGFNGGPGGSQQDTNALRIFDPTTGMWTPGMPAPVAKAEGYRGVAHGGSLYCVAGRSSQDGFKPESSMLSFNPATQMWSTLMPMPPACNGQPCAGTAAVTFAKNIFVFGGRDSGNGPCTGNASTSIYRYDIPSNTWSQALGSGSLPAVSDATAARVGGYIYIFGGCNANGSSDPKSAHYYNNVWKYNPRTGNVTTLGATMPTPRADAAAGDPQNGSSANASHLIHVTGGLCLNQSTHDPASGGCPLPTTDAAGDVVTVTPNHIAFDVDQQQFTATPGTEMPRHCMDVNEGPYVYDPMAPARYEPSPIITWSTPEQDRAEHELVYGGDRIYAIGGACPAYGRSLDNLDVQMLSGPGDPPAPSASLTAYSCNANTFPVCATEPLGVSVVLVTASGFAPLSTVSLTSSSQSTVASSVTTATTLPATVSDVQGEFVTTYVDTDCNGSAHTVTGTDSAGHQASVTFTCPTS